jgi:transposase
MTYTGIDYHKRYTVDRTLDAQGRKLQERRIDGNGVAAFTSYFKQLGAPSEVVIEACWNGGALYDLLEGIDGVAKVVLSHPAKNRIIADAQIKNDRVDAKALATLLRGDFVAKVHVPSRDVRQRKNVVRQRLWLARVRTMIRNRIHTVVDRHPHLERPAVKDLFSNAGKAWMKRAPLPAADRTLLDEDLALHSLVQNHIDALEAVIATDNQKNPVARRLQSLPGILAPVIALEIDDITRFAHADKLCAYAGLVPTTHASGGKIAHRRMLPFCNRWLKWAFIEAAWVAVGCSDYFGSFYRQQRLRGKGANSAITIVARRMAKITWKCSPMSEVTAQFPRTFQTNFPGRFS